MIEYIMFHTDKDENAYLDTETVAERLDPSIRRLQALAIKLKEQRPSPRLLVAVQTALKNVGSACPPVHQLPKGVGIGRTHEDTLCTVTALALDSEAASVVRSWVRRDLPQAVLVGLEKVDNKAQDIQFECQRQVLGLLGSPTDTEMLWHGTRGVDPRAIVTSAECLGECAATSTVLFRH